MTKIYTKQEIETAIETYVDRTIIQNGVNPGSMSNERYDAISAAITREMLYACLQSDISLTMYRCKLGIIDQQGGK